MLSAILRAPLARSLFLSSASRFAKPAATARPLLFLEARRTFLTTASSAEEAKTTKEKKPKKASETQATKAKKETKAKKVTTAKATKVKKVKAVKPKEPVVYKKDLTPPQKRPKTAWQDFYLQYQVEHQQPGDKFGAYAAEAAALWKTMSVEEKAKYGASEEERAEYAKVVADYRATNPAFKRAAKKFRKKRHGPLGSYNLFIRENFDKTSPLKMFDQASELAKRWREMSLGEKFEYKQRAIELYERSQVAEAEK